MSTSTPPSGQAGDPGAAGAPQDPVQGDPAGSDPATAPEAQRDAEPADGHGGRRRWTSSLLEYAVTMVSALVIAVLVKTFLIQPFYIPSPSMDPTLQVDDKIIVSKLTPGVFDLERGDVIVFRDPADWLERDAAQSPTVGTRISSLLSLVGLAPDPSQDHLVKRLIGLPGDHVACAARGAQLQVNGVTLDEPYINPEGRACQDAFEATVPAGSLFVMGDNRYNSADSAFHLVHDEEAFVPIDDVTGKAVVVFWPMSRWTGLGEGQDAFSEVPDAP